MQNIKILDHKLYTYVTQSRSERNYFKPLADL